MTLRFSLPLLLALVAPTALSGASESPPPWPFDVTPTCAPRISWPLARFKSSGFADGLTVVHQLVFDGKGYFSRIIIPELSSYLIKGDHGSYYWHNPANDEIILKPGIPNGVWLLTENADGTEQIAAAHGGVTLDYAGTNLLTMIRDDHHYQFSYFENRLTEIAESNANENPVIVSVKHNTQGMIETIMVDGKSFAFDYEAVIFLKNIREIGANRSADFGYKNRLLTTVDIIDKSEAHLTFQWGSVQSLSLFTLTSPPPPVVIGDRQVSYSVQSDPSGLRVTYQSKADKSHFGTWLVKKNTSLLQLMPGRR